MDANDTLLIDNSPALSPIESFWDKHVCTQLMGELTELRREMLALERAFGPTLAEMTDENRPSARNLIHYLAFRQKDRRELQERLARLGLSSLGRAESHVMANLDKVLGILHRLAGEPWVPRSEDEPVGIHSSRRLLDRHSLDLLGEPTSTRSVRIMVTLPPSAAQDVDLPVKLIESGMDIARINCAHDDAEAWACMVARLREAAQAQGRKLKILMDLGGPKLRTASVDSGEAVLKLKPKRDALGQVVTPALLGLRGAESRAPVEGTQFTVNVAGEWLEALTLGEFVEFVDGRGSKRRCRVVRRDGGQAVLECSKSAYLLPQTKLQRQKKLGGPRKTRIDGVPIKPAFVRLVRGDELLLVRPGFQPTENDLPCIACTLPDVFDQVRVGERIFFDDGHIGGRIKNISPNCLTIDITQAAPDGSKLGGDKGINLPDSQLDLPALTAKDLHDLPSVVKLADMVGLSFVQRTSDIDTLSQRLDALGASTMGIILKIETRQAFSHLPDLLLSAMKQRLTGVMIARGDLAVECGYERLAEVQEEILWLAEAAHLPVIWATQVLETLAKTGLPSRAEITDAAMGERAECVMLNKGPYIVDAIRMLDDILVRMQCHQSKKRPLLRKLTSWLPTQASVAQ